MHPICIVTELRIEWHANEPNLRMLWEELFDFALYVSELQDQFGPNVLTHILDEELWSDRWEAVYSLADQGKYLEARQLRDQMNSQGGALGLKVSSRS